MLLPIYFSGISDILTVNVFNRPYKHIRAKRKGR